MSEQQIPADIDKIRANLVEMRLLLENKELSDLKSNLDQTHMTVTLRGGIEVWGVEFVQWLEDRLDTLDGFERVGKSVTDDYIHIHMQTKTAWYQAGKVTR